MMDFRLPNQIQRDIPSEYVRLEETVDSPDWEASSRWDSVG